MSLSPDLRPGKAPEQTPHINYSDTMDALDRKLPQGVLFRMGKNDKVVDERVFMLTGSNDTLFLTKDGVYKTQTMMEINDLRSTEGLSRYVILSCINSGNAREGEINGRYHKENDTGKIDISMPQQPDGSLNLALSTQATSHLNNIFPVSIDDFKQALTQVLTRTS